MTLQERAAFDALVIAWNVFAARRGINGCVQPIASAPKAAPPPKPLR